jgi:hypothetical protein
VKQVAELFLRLCVDGLVEELHEIGASHDEFPPEGLIAGDVPAKPLSSWRGGSVLHGHEYKPEAC